VNFLLSKDKIKDFLRPYYYTAIDVFDPNKELTLRNETLQSKYEGNRVFFFLSGEPLSCIDIPKLKDEHTFGYGYLFLNKEIVDLPLKFFLCTDGKRKEDKVPNTNWPENLLTSMGRNHAYIYLKQVKENFADRGTILFLNSDNFKYLKKSELFNLFDPKIFFIKRKKDLRTIKSPKFDLTKRFSGGGGGVFESIFIMIYMGFKEIYLCGAGYTYNPLYYLHFYDNYAFPKSLGKEKAIIEAKKAIVARNKIDDARLEYYGLLEKGDLFRGIYIKRVSKDYPLWKAHSLIKQYAESLGVRILNIVPEGFESLVFEKTTWQDVVTLLDSVNSNSKSNC